MFEFDPVLIRQFKKKLQSDPILNRQKLALVQIQSDPVLSVVISGALNGFGNFPYSKAWVKGSWKRCCHFWCFNFKSDVCFREISDVCCFSDKSDVDWTCCFCFPHFFSLQDENKLDSWFLSFFSSISPLCAFGYHSKLKELPSLHWVHHIGVDLP